MTALLAAAARDRRLPHRYVRIYVVIALELAGGPRTIKIRWLARAAGVDAGGVSRALAALCRLGYLAPAGRVDGLRAYQLPPFV